MNVKKQWSVHLAITLITTLITLMATWSLLIVETTDAVAEETEKKADYEAGFYYTIQKGDTLWDLSQRFDDSPWLWPDLWQKNTQITNPHLIYPGERIRLFRKKDHQRYGVEAEENPAPASGAPQIEAAKPVKETPLEVYYLYANIDRVGFIRKPAVQPLGDIFKTRDDKQLISEGDLVYINRLESQASVEFIPGMRLLVYNTQKPNDERGSESTYGTQHYILGIVEITRIETDYVMAKVIQSFRAIHVGDLVMPYNPRNPEISVVNSTPGIEGHIIGGEEHTTLMGDLFIAFIDKGKQDNILTGQIYDIYYQEYAQAGKKDVLLDKVHMGSVLVLHTEENNSTVVITSSNRQIKAGEKIKTP